MRLRQTPCADRPEAGHKQTNLPARRCFLRAWLLACVWPSAPPCNSQSSCREGRESSGPSGRPGCGASIAELRLRRPGTRWPWLYKGRSSRAAFPVRLGPGSPYTDRDSPQRVRDQKTPVRRTKAAPPSRKEITRPAHVDCPLEQRSLSVKYFDSNYSVAAVYSCLT